MTLVPDPLSASPPPDPGAAAASAVQVSNRQDGPAPVTQRVGRFLRRPLWNRLTTLQLSVVGLASIPPVMIAGAVSAYLLGFATEAEMIDVALGAGENPGTIMFGAMFLASPVQWLTGRSQVRVRKFLGIVFYLLAPSNGAMFAIEDGIAQALSSPFLIAGSAALAIGLPLFLTSSTWAQRTLGMQRWRLLHKATYAVAAALLAHVLMIGELDLGSALIAIGFAARIPAISERLKAIGARA